MPSTGKVKLILFLAATDSNEAFIAAVFPKGFTSA